MIFNIDDVLCFLKGKYTVLREKEDGKRPWVPVGAVALAVAAVYESFTGLFSSSQN
jgi:hypothetical protein